MRGATRRRARLLTRILIVGTLVGVVYGGFINLAVGGTGWTGSLVGAVNGFAITAVIGSIEVLLLQTRWGFAFGRHRSW